MFNFERLKETNLPFIIDMFKEKDFYFMTKRPDSLTEGNIKRIISKEDNKLFIIFYKEKPCGLVFLEEDKIENEAVYLHIRFLNMDLLLKNTNAIWKQICSKIKDYQIVKVKIYDFDEYGKLFCKKLSFTKEAVLRKHVFKFNSYQDLIIYSKKMYEGE